jgi:hypothetical protein
MAINTYRFWMATDANRLLANQFAFIQAAAPAFYQGNVANLELHIVATSGVGTSPVEMPFPAGASISVAVGDTNTYPTGGFWGLLVDDVQTEPMPYNATTTQVASALNSLPSVASSGGLAVSKTGDGYTITWNTYGLKPTIGIGSDTLTPSSYESISLVQAGSVNHRQIVFVELRQNPIALGTTWTPLPSPSVTVSDVQAWNGTNRIWRVGISPQPKAGSINISYGTKSATLSYDASVASIASALSPAQVFATGQFQWDIVIDEDSVLTASGSLVGYNGYFGSINFATAECHQFLAGAERKPTALEVSMSIDDERFTLIQTPCNVFADVVSDGVIQPLPLGTAISEQVANARFVRRDIDQNPDAATQDVIWQNLGIETLGSDVAGALNAADSPSAANPFATISDIPSVLPAEWGNITGTLSDQTDLQSALDDKYDASNPAGYATESWVNSQGFQTSPFNGGDVSNPIKVKAQAEDTWGATVTSTGVSVLSETGFYGNFSADMGTGGFFASWAIFPNFPSVALVPGSGLTVTENGIATVVNNGILTYNGEEPYARKDGVTFTGKVNTTVTATTAPLNIAPQGTAPSSTVAGDVWIGNFNMFFRDANGNQRTIPTQSTSNVFSSPQVIDTTSTTPALRITQKGIVAGQSRAIVVEDETTPDQHCFIIDQSGNVGVGVSNDPNNNPWVAGSSKVEVVGNVNATTLSTGSGPTFSINGTASHTGGSDTLDAIVTINGVNYRIALRPA